MSDEFRINSNSVQNSTSTGQKQMDLSSKCAQCGRNTNSNIKSEGDNKWSSVPITYDKEESTHKHEKSETDNQWTSTSK